MTAEPNRGRAVDVGENQPGRLSMFKGGLLWLIGIPIPIILLLLLFGVL
jgi:hypothetical protein